MLIPSMGFLFGFLVLGLKVVDCGLMGAEIWRVMELMED